MIISFTETALGGRTQSFTQSFTSPVKKRKKTTENKEKKEIKLAEENEAWLMANDSCLRGHHSFLRMEGDTSFVMANHYSLEHKQGEQCQVQVERTKYPGGRKKTALKETWLTYENNYSWTDKQQNPDAERNTGDSNWLLPCENRTRRKHCSTLRSLVFCSLCQRSQENTVFLLPNSCTSHETFCQQTLSPRKDAFLSSVHTVPVFVCSVNSPQKDVLHVFYFRTRFLLLLLRVSTRLQLDLMETVISPVCVSARLCYSLAWLCDYSWPLHSLQRESPGLTTRSMDMSWWKTWVTRFMAIRAADENGKAWGGLKKMNASISLIF